MKLPGLFPAHCERPTAPNTSDSRHPQVCKVEEQEGGACGSPGKPQCSPRGAFSLPYDILILGVSSSVVVPPTRECLLVPVLRSFLRACDVLQDDRNGARNCMTAQHPLPLVPRFASLRPGLHLPPLWHSRWARSTTPLASRASPSQTAATS